MDKPISLILACYNEGPTFENSVKKIVSSLKKQKLRYEIIFVEDKSTDYTLEAVKKLTKIVKNSRILTHGKNLGRGKTVSDGIKLAKYEYCGFMDVDCEVSPTYIKLFVKKLSEGADMVVGVRFYEKGLSSISRFLASKIYSLLVRVVLNIPTKDTEVGFKFFKKSKIKPVLDRTKNNGWFWDTEVCARAYKTGLKITEVPVLFIRRKDKKTTVKLFRDSFEYFIKLLEFRGQF